MSELVQNPDGTTTEYDGFGPNEATLTALLRDLFENHWPSLRFGPCIQGAVYELVLTEPPKQVDVLDGYLTVDAGPWHFHLCIGEHKGSTPEAARIRRCSKAAFFTTKGTRCTGQSWGLRLWNGAGEQMITIFFPNPNLDQKLRRVQTPDLSKLELWKAMRARYAGVRD